MAGVRLPGFEGTTWYGLVGPAKMNPAMVKRMNEDVNKALAMPDVMEKLEHPAPRTAAARS
jgi:tripartite-type tricarboxylate transporter receptor subunit TctC